MCTTDVVFATQVTSVPTRVGPEAFTLGADAFSAYSNNDLKLLGQVWRPLLLM
jgi:hypothetical protein